MANPFSGLINAALKDTFNDAIDALIEGCEAPCRLYGVKTIYEACTDCEDTNIGLRGPNPFNTGGNGKHRGICATCNGEKKVGIDTPETVNMIVIWDYEEMKELAGQVKVKKGDVQTFCNINLANQIKNCSHIIFNTNIEQYGEHKFVRASEPTPMGFGSDRYILTTWKKA